MFALPSYQENFALVVVEALARFLDDPDLRARAADCGPRLVDQQFNWDHSVSQLEQVYAHVLATTPQ